MLAQMKLVDYVKWLATLIQLIGYGMIGLNMVPYNIYLFFYRYFSVVCGWCDVEG